MTRKLILVALIIACSSSMLFAQEYYEDEIFLEENTYNTFIYRVGRVIETNEVKIGTFKQAKAVVKTLTDLTSSEKLSAVLFSKEAQSEYGYGVQAIPVDAHEFDRFMSSIKLIHNSLNAADARDGLELVYRSREGVSFGGSVVDGKVKQYLQLSQYDESSYIYLDNKDYEDFMQLLRACKEKL